MVTKSRWISVILIFLLAAGFISCSSGQPSSYWLVLYAFSTEGELLHSHMTAVRDTVWAGRSIAVGFLEDEPVILVGSGIGTTNAAITLQHIFDHYPVEGVLFTGICGAVAEQIEIGDIVIPDHWVTHDYGYIGAQGFEPDSINIGFPDAPTFINVIKLPVDEKLQDRICRAAYKAAGEFKPVVDRMVQIYCGGAGATGNQFIDQTEKREWIAEQFEAQIVDMESAAVLQTAIANGVPCVIIRSASDLAGGSGSATAAIELREFFKIAADNSAAVVRSYFRMQHLGTFELEDVQNQ